MPKKTFEQILFVFIFSIFINTIAFSKVERLRCMWRTDPTTTMVIGWDQTANSNPILYYTDKKLPGNIEQYAKKQTPDRVIVIKGMNNHFVRLKGLRPNTVYYFKIKDTGGSTKVHSFQTAPASPYTRLSIIAGGDSRNHKSARISANKLVGKLRPHFVLFGGDMTASDNNTQWLEWFDDWQYTISDDRRLTPIVVARGNHEYSNKTLVDLFDVQTNDLFYAHTFGTDMLRIYTLNSLIPSGGKQKEWLAKDLQKNDHIQWKMAQYHHTIRPHTKLKPEKNEMLLNWATLFYKYQVKLVVESDAHVVKTTYPIKPFRGSGSYEGFIQDDLLGTVYVGEGCWGAPLRKNDDLKPWTRASGSFNQFKWIFIDREKIEVRTVKTDGADAIGSVDPFNVFIPPLGLNIWEPASGAVLTIENNALVSPATFGNNVGEELAARGVHMKVDKFKADLKGKDIYVSWQVKNEQPSCRFEVQRSFGDEKYVTVGKMTGQAQGSIGNFTYKFVDKGLGETAQGRYIRYRLKHIHPSGKEGLYHPPIPKLKGEGAIATSSSSIKKLMTDKNSRLQFKYQLGKTAKINYQIFDVNRREVFNNQLNNQPPKNYLKSLDLKALRNGRYVLVIKADDEEIERYQVIKR